METKKEDPKVSKPITTAPAVSVKEKISKIRTFLKTKEGAVGFNPFLWDKEVLQPLIERKDEARILELPDEPDCSIEQFNFKGVPSVIRKMEQEKKL